MPNPSPHPTNNFEPIYSLYFLSFKEFNIYQGCALRRWLRGSSWSVFWTYEIQGAKYVPWVPEAFSSCCLRQKLSSEVAIVTNQKKFFPTRHGKKKPSGTQGTKYADFSEKSNSRESRINTDWFPNERWRRKLLGGPGACSPGKCLDFYSLKSPFPPGDEPLEPGKLQPQPFLRFPLQWANTKKYNC